MFKKALILAACVLMFTVGLAACRDNDPQRADSKTIVQKVAVEAAAVKYVNAYLDGDVASTISMRSQRCQQSISRDRTQWEAEYIAAHYGHVSLTSIDEDVHGTHATVHAKYSDPALDVSTGRSWVLESGAWKWDGCDAKSVAATS